jgi:hypothetical protein
MTVGFNDGLIYTSPPPGDRVVQRVPVHGETCPECGSSDVRRYPIGWVRGPRIAVKCQACFYALEIRVPSREDAWPPFRSATWDWEASPAERAGASRPGAR